MSGTSHRIGVIYPSDGVLDGELWRCVPPGVSVHVTRSLSSADLDSNLKQVERHVLMAQSQDVEDAAGTFSLIGAGCVTYACTAGSFGRGAGYDTQIIERISAASGSPASTTSTAVVAALRELGVRRLAVAAPYEDEVCDRLRTFLEDSGFDVLNLVNLGLSGTDIGAVPLGQVHALAENAVAPGTEALFISCTAFPTIDILDSLERHLGIPVVSSNQATMWHALQIAGLPARLEGLGRLYELQAATARA